MRSTPTFIPLILYHLYTTPICNITEIQYSRTLWNIFECICVCIIMYLCLSYNVFEWNIFSILHHITFFRLTSNLSTSTSLLLLVIFLNGNFAWRIKCEYLYITLWCIIQHTWLMRVYRFFLKNYKMHNLHVCLNFQMFLC